LLSEGSIPKEIASSLNISYATVLEHQKSIYRKLNVHSINELFSKMTIMKNEADFMSWIIIEDKNGSKISVTKNIENIKDKYYKTYVITGKLCTGKDSYVGAYFIPNTFTLEALKKMSSLSLTCLGDGGSYVIILPTTDTRLKSGNNHYGRVFSTKNGEMSKITLNINEFSQSPNFGNIVLFDKNNIEGFQIHACSFGEYNLKFWDINFY
jgi:hypothetical protein